MPSPSSHKAVIAAAGSGKTETIIRSALALPPAEKVLILTYTTHNANELRQRITTKAGVIPPNITVLTWFAFILRHGLKPYCKPLLGINGVAGIAFNKNHPRFARKSNPRIYYFNATGYAYEDVATEAVLHLDTLSGGAVFERLDRLFDHVFVDEAQDLSGRDPELVEALMSVMNTVTLVGDPRQRTYGTTNSATNRGSTGAHILAWLRRLKKAGTIDIDELDHSERCHQSICDVADSLYPDLPATTSRNQDVTGHDGVFLLAPADVPAYVSQFATPPQVLIWSKGAENWGLDARNMGDSKGLTFDRVVITPTNPITKHITNGDDIPDITRAKLYVAITRARQSVAIVIDSPGSSTLPVWRPTV